MIKGNILLVIDSMGAGGAERVTLTLAQGFVNEGYKVDLIICDNIIRFEIPENINLHILDFKKSFLDYTKYSRKLHQMVDKIKETNKQDFDLILVELQKATKLMKNYKHHNIYFAIQSTLSQSSFRNRKGLRLFLKRKTLQNIYKSLNIITCSYGIQDDLINVIKIQPKSIQTIFNPVDIDTIKELSLKNNSINEQNYIVHIGRLAQVKRHDILIKAFAKSTIDAKLVLVGDGEEKENILSLIKNLNIEDKVILTGFLQNPYPILKNAKLFVLSSEYEGLPTVLIEALALETLIISTNCKSGPREIMTGELEQYLVEVNNIESLSNKIEMVYKQPYKIPNKLIDNFSLNNIITKYMTLINI
jgi:glycosyltransferase involved in cell wall biosynthesis